MDLQYKKMKPEHQDLLIQKLMGLPSIHTQLRSVLNKVNPLICWADNEQMFISSGDVMKVINALNLNL